MKNTDAWLRGKYKKIRDAAGKADASVVKTAKTVAKPIASLVKGTVKNITQPDQNTLYGKRSSFKDGLRDTKAIFKKK